MKPETQTKLIIYGYVITIFCLRIMAFYGPIYYVIIKQEEIIKQEIKAWE